MVLTVFPRHVRILITLSGLHDGSPTHSAGLRAVAVSRSGGSTPGQHGNRSRYRRPRRVRALGPARRRRHSRCRCARCRLRATSSRAPSSTSPRSPIVGIRCRNRLNTVFVEVREMIPLSCPGRVEGQESMEGRCIPKCSRTTKRFTTTPTPTASNTHGKARPHGAAAHAIAGAIPNCCRACSREDDAGRSVLERA